MENVIYSSRENIAMTVNLEGMIPEAKDDCEGFVRPPNLMNLTYSQYEFENYSTEMDTDLVSMLRYQLDGVILTPIAVLGVIGR